jgi:folate-dependent tRNA-U54 methylase TrmFO/GidA
MDTSLKVRTRDDGLYSVVSKGIDKIGSRGLATLVREGFSINVTTILQDNQEVDVTLETLAKLALNGEYGYDKDNEKTDIIIGILTAANLANQTDYEASKDALYLIIENGGLNTFLLRQAKGMVQL